MMWKFRLQYSTVFREAKAARCLNTRQYDQLEKTQKLAIAVFLCAVYDVKLFKGYGFKHCQPQRASRQTHKQVHAQANRAVGMSYDFEVGSFTFLS